MNTLARRAALAASLLLCACACPDAQMASADVATYEWFAPMFAAYVADDSKLSEQDKATYLRGLEAWRERVMAAAKATGVR
jgi:hypothetical protein